MDFKNSKINQKFRCDFYNKRVDIDPTTYRISGVKYEVIDGSDPAPAQGWRI